MLVHTTTMDAGSSSNNATDTFVYMGEGSEVPRDVVNVQVHPSVRAIPDEAFQDCSKLEKVDISEGVVEIGQYAFSGTTLLKEISIPSSVKIIHRMAFSNSRAGNMHLPEGLENIGYGAFCGGMLPVKFRIPPLIATLEGGVLFGCRYMISLELSEDMRELEGEALAACSSLRNLALPFDGNIFVEENILEECTDLLQVSDGSEEELIDTLRNRFDNLPIHKMSYYQSYNNLTSEQLTDATNMRSGSSRSLRSKLDPSGNQQDTLGMTPLHILACSTVQNVDMYRIIIEKYPDNLITKDKWGALPLLYVIWGQTCSSIQWFLAGRYHSLYPEHAINWEDMFETLAKGDAPWETLAEFSRFSELYNCLYGRGWIDWNKLMYKLADSTPFDGSRITPNAIHYLVSKALLPRLRNIGVWYSIFLEEALTWEKAKACVNKRAYLNEILSELEQYESKYRDMKDATTQLELALWDKKIEESRQMKKRPRKAKKTNDSSSFRNQCRVSCGASIVIPHVLPFLIPEKYLSSVDLYSSVEEEEWW